MKRMMTTTEKLELKVIKSLLNQSNKYNKHQRSNVLQFIRPRSVTTKKAA